MSCGTVKKPEELNVKFWKQGKQETNKMSEGIKTNLEPSPEAKIKHDVSISLPITKNFSQLRLQEYCRELNMDKEAQEESWKNFVNTTKKHVLEVSFLHSVFY